jgi:hypothetical protein
MSYASISDLVRGSWKRLVALGLIGLVLASVTLANHRYATNSPGGTDFVSRWLGTRLLLTEGKSPYSEATSRAIQTFVYGGKVKPEKDQVLFAYPLYSIVVFAPFAAIQDYVMARTAWMTLLEMAIVALALVGLKLAKLRFSFGGFVVILLFSILWYHSARPLINGNPSILSALFVATGLLLVEKDRDIAAGIMFALATIKPQLVILLIPAILYWAYKRRRKQLIAGTLATILFLVLGATAIQPNWMLENLRQIQAYSSYTLAGTPGEMLETWWPFIGKYLGYLLTMTLLALYAWQVRMLRNASYKTFLFICYLILVITNLIGIRTATSNYIAMLPGIFLVLSALQASDKMHIRWSSWGIVAGFFFGLWILFWTTQFNRTQDPIMFFPLPLFLLFTLPLLQSRSIQQ